MSITKEILKIKEIMGLRNESTADPEKYREDKNYGYGEGTSMEQNIAKNKALTNARINLLSKQGKDSGNISGQKIVAEKVLNSVNGFKYIVAIQGTIG